MSATHALPDSLPTGTSKEREALQLCEEKDQRLGKRETDGNRISMYGSNACLRQVLKDKEKKPSDERAATASASTQNMQSSGRSISTMIHGSIQAIDQITIPLVGAVSGRKGAVPKCRVQIKIGLCVFQGIIAVWEVEGLFWDRNR